MNTAIILNGNQVNNPTNIKGLEVELNFDTDDGLKQSVSLTNMEFINEEAKQINDYLNAGLSSGLGIFHGMPIQITLVSNGVNSELLDGYLDLTTAEFDCDLVSVNALPKKQIDWLNEVADSKTFEYILKQEKGFSADDYVFMPYVISTIPNYKDLLLAQVSTFMIVNEITKVATELAAYIGEGATVIDTVGAIIRLVSLIIYSILLLITLIGLILSTINLLIQPIKYKPTMYLRDLFEIGCKSFGLKFQSTILSSVPYRDAVLIPQSYSNPEDLENNNVVGFIKPNITEQNGYYRGTVGDFIRDMKTLFNGKNVIIGDTLHFVKADELIGQPQFQLPSVDQHTFTTNADEIKSQFNFAFSYDINDKNTINEWQGTNVQVNLQPKISGDRDYYLLKNAQIISSRFALAKRKTTLTGVEKLIDVFLGGIDAVIGAFINSTNAVTRLVNSLARTLKKIQTLLKLVGVSKVFSIPSIPDMSDDNNFGSLIDDRIGMMKLENDIISVPKVAVIIKGRIDRKTKIDANNDVYFSGLEMFNKFYTNSSFVPSTNHNQYKMFSVNRIPFTFDNYLQVKDNPRLLTFDGKIGEIISLKWNIYQRTANIDFKVNEIYTNNLEQVIYEPTGR